MVDRGREEVHVGVQPLLREHSVLDPARHPVIGIVTRRLGQFSRQDAQVGGARVFYLVHPVAKAHDLLAAAEPGRYLGARGFDRVVLGVLGDLLHRAHDLLVGAAMQRTLERPQGRHHR